LLRYVHDYSCIFILFPSDSKERDTEEEFALETAHEKHVRLTKKAISAALRTDFAKCFSQGLVGSDEEDATASLSLQLQEEALQARGKLFARVASNIKTVEVDDAVCLRGHKKSVNCICISSDSKFLFSGGKDASIIKWCLKEHKKLMSVDGGRRGSASKYHTGPVLSIAISDDSKYLASGSTDNSIIIWNPLDMNPIFHLKRHLSPVTAISFRRQSHMLFTGDRSGRVCVWNMPLTEILQDQGAATKIEVLSICGLSAERCISSSGFGGAGICLWKVEEEVCVQYNVKNISELSIECIYAVNDDLFLGGSTSNTLYLWHVSRGSPICRICPAHPPSSQGPLRLPTERPAVNWVTAVAGLFGTDLFASGSSTGHVQLWKLVVEGKEFSFDDSGKAGPEQEEDDDEEATSFVRRGGIGRRLRVHHDNTRIERIPGADFHLAGFINSLAFSNDGQWLAIGIGQEHRLGRWEERRKVNDLVCLLPINIPISQQRARFALND
uniref:WD_REPEATS_REGION domain-containing protein n=1 Tax=Schistocephalus solidus TaxID=70667 RepID=A0A183THI4_SCHSO